MTSRKVIDPNPTMARSVASASIGDAARFAFWAVAGTAFGWMTARPAIARIQRVNAIAGLVVGGAGGFLLMAQRSEQRLMGLRD